MNIIPFSQGLELKRLSKGVQQGGKTLVKGGNQGGNQGGNFVKAVPSSAKALNGNGLTENEAWISAKEGGNLLHVTDRAVKKNCKAGKYVTQLVQGNGGMQYRIALSSLPVDAQMRWRKEHGFVVEEMEKTAESNCKPFDEMSEQQRQTALDRYDVVMHYKEAISRAKHGMILEAKESFVARYAAGEWPILLERIGTTTWKTIDRWIQTLKEHNGLPSSLAPNYRYVRAGSSVVGVSALQAQVILAYYLDPRQPKISEVVRKTNGKLRQMNQEQVTESRIRHLIKQYTENHSSEVTMARQGEKAYNDCIAPYIKRDWDKIKPFDQVVSDGHVISFPIQNPFTRKSKRMSLIFHEDCRTKMVLGWEIMPTENTQAIASSFRRAMLWGGYLLTGLEDTAVVPKVMLIDNGRAFKSHFFTGSPGATMAASGFSGLYDQLRPYGFEGVQYSRIYNGQEKPVERTWGDFSELERSMPNYTGTSIAYKPARLMRGEFMHRELAERLQMNVVPTIEEAHYQIALWLHEYHQRDRKQSRITKGLCSYEAMEIGLKELRVRDGEGLSNRILSGGELRFLMMQQITRSLKRNGITLFGRQYLSPELHDMAKGERELVVRYDLDRLDHVAVYHPNGEFVGIAPEWCPNGGIHPAAKLLGSAADVEQYHAAAKVQAGLRNETKKLAKRGIIAAAEKGFSDLMGRDIMPAVARLRAKADDALERSEKAAKKRTGTDNMEIPAEFRIVEPEQAPVMDLPHYLDC